MNSDGMCGAGCGRPAKINATNSKPQRTCGAYACIIKCRNQSRPSTYETQTGHQLPLQEWPAWMAESKPFADNVRTVATGKVRRIEPIDGSGRSSSAGWETGE